MEYLGFTQTNKLFINKGIEAIKFVTDARHLQITFKKACR